ncbi:hypothetical protein GCM10009815_20820 [Nocardioides marmoribigeumensis]
MGGSPTLSWTRVSGAKTYEVKVATNESFTSSSVKYSTTTVNRQVVPNVALPVGTIFWEVRARNSDGTSEWSTNYFDHSRSSGPTLISPADGAVLDQPDDPVVLSWTPTPGATRYSVEISTDEAFSTILKTYTPTTSSVLADAPGLQNTYYWRVRADLGSGIYTEFSPYRRYGTTGMDAPELVSPGASGLETVQDVVLDWKPVKGAKSYNLQVSTDQNFNTFDLQVPNIVGTKYSPPTTLDNDQYYWRVQPVNAANQTLDWSSVPTGTFRRNWPDQPTLEYPGRSFQAGTPPVVRDPIYFQWTPMAHASRYRLEIDTDTDFQNLFDSCITQTTTFVPSELNDCFPAAAGTYYWRVVGLDDPRTPSVQSEAIFSPIWTFSYDPDRVDMSTVIPRGGESVTFPTLKWDPVRGAASYRVYVYRTSDNVAVVNGATTYATSYTPRKALEAGKTYRWYAKPVSVSGRVGAGLLPAAMATFNLVDPDAATATTPEPTGPVDGTEFKRFPTLSWTPVAGAATYRIGVRLANGISGFADLGETFAYPEGQDDSTTYLPSATYQWSVTAYDIDNNELTSTLNPRTFKIVEFPATQDQRVAMSGLASNDNATSCTAVLDQRCENTRQTPVLRWSPVTDAGFYRVQLWHDRNRTNAVANSVLVDQPMYMRPAELPDSQASDAYYWTVEACRGSKSFPVCRSTVQSPARWAFNKLSNPVEGLAPGVPVNATGTPVDATATVPTIPDEINFSWKDYKATNWDDPSASEMDSVDEKGRLEARTYRVEVSTTPNFSTVVETRDVDQTTFTAFARAYPDGVLYWRVRAVDAAGNLLAPSPTYKVIKKSPAPMLTVMPNGRAVSGSEPFRWQPLDYAAGYDIEIYKNDDTLGQPANRVVSVSSSQAALVLSTNPLPVSTSPYRWRVRKYDASGNRAAWSSLSTSAAQFTIVGAKPTLLSPSASAYVAPTNSYFTWGAVARATKYRFERRAPGASSNAESVTTPALAWAPSQALAQGSWQWRVVALDASGAQLGASSWRSFSVDTVRPTVTSKTPTGNVAVTTNFTARFSEKVTKVSTSTFRLYRSGTPDPLPAVVTLNSTGTSAVLNPSANLRKGKTYYVRLTTGIKDPAGNSLVATSWKVLGK